MLVPKDRYLPAASRQPQPHKAATQHPCLNALTHRKTTFPSAVATLPAGNILRKKPAKFPFLIHDFSFFVRNSPRAPSQNSRCHGKFPFPHAIQRLSESVHNLLNIHFSVA